MEPEISPGELEDGVTLVDVRTDAEWAAGRLPGAIHIPLPELSARAAETGSGRLVFYCRTGDRSRMAAEAFRGEGREAASLRGGLEAWRAEGRSVES